MKMSSEKWSPFSSGGDELIFGTALINVAPCFVCSISWLCFHINNPFRDSLRKGPVTVFDFNAGPSARGRQLNGWACNLKNVSALLTGSIYTQVGGSHRSMYGTQTGCATWFSIVVRRSTYMANGIPHVTKLCLIMRETISNWRCDWRNMGRSCHTSYCTCIVYVEPRFPEIQAGKHLWLTHWWRRQRIERRLSWEAGNSERKSLIRRVYKVSTRVSSYRSDLKLTAHTERVF